MDPVSTGPKGKAGLDFTASLPDVGPEALDMTVQMDSSGTGILLRDKNRRLLLQLNGNQIAELAREGVLDVRTPDMLKKSVVEYWKARRAAPAWPTSFSLALPEEINAAELHGKLKLLMDWLQEREDLTINVAGVLRVVQQPAPQPAAQPEQSTPIPEQSEEPAAPSEQSEPPAEEPATEPVPESAPSEPDASEPPPESAPEDEEEPESEPSDDKEA